MGRFRKRPIVVDAVTVEEVLSTPVELLPQWVVDARRGASIRFATSGSAALLVYTPEGVMYAHRGDWIVRGVKGELYPCMPDVFEKTYEPEGDLDLPHKLVMQVKLEVEAVALAFQKDGRHKDSDFVLARMSDALKRAGLAAGIPADDPWLKPAIETFAKYRKPFTVTCDETNNTPEDAAAGRVNVDVSVQLPDPTHCLCGAHYSEPHHKDCPVVAARRAKDAENEKRRAEEHANSFQGRVEALGFAPRFEVRKILLPHSMTSWIVQDTAAKAICSCGIEEIAKLVSEALNAAYDE